MNNILVTYRNEIFFLSLGNTLQSTPAIVGIEIGAFQLSKKWDSCLEMPLFTSFFSSKMASTTL